MREVSYLKQYLLFYMFLHTMAFILVCDKLRETGNCGYIKESNLFFFCSVKVGSERLVVAGRYVCGPEVSCCRQHTVKPGTKSLLNICSHCLVWRLWLGFYPTPQPDLVRRVLHLSSPPLNTRNVGIS